jgi:DNA-binding FadR family transcriptional regulator
MAGSASIPPAIFTPSRRRRAFDEILSQVRALIAQGDLPPGSRLPSERALAEQFEVSRNTIREALRMLEISGLVELKRGASGGAFVTAGSPGLAAQSFSDALQSRPFSINDVTEALLWVSTIEVRVACERISDADILALEANVAEVERLTDESRWHEKAMIHLDFHLLLAEAINNPVLVLIVRSLMQVLKDVVLRVGPTQDDYIIKSRRRLLAYLRKRDVNGAITEMERYTRKLHSLWLDGGYRGAYPGGLTAVRRKPADSGDAQAAGTIAETPRKPRRPRSRAGTGTAADA